MGLASDGNLTASQEDYLEAILGLVRENGVARVRDIARSLQVAMPSVTGALKTLARRGLVDYHPYKLVTLSNRGRKLAEQVSRRHDALRDFLTTVLGVDAKTADANACRMEHGLDADVLRRLCGLVAFVGSEPLGLKDWREAFGKFLAEREHDEAIESGKGDAMTTLAQIKPGHKAKIVKITGAAATNRRLADMGVVRNTVVAVVKVAPLGDPVEIKVRGYSLSLRKAEAETIEVEAL